MLFYKRPSRPKLRVVRLPVEDRRTYITDRVEAMLPRLGGRYRVEVVPAATYLGAKFEQCVVFEHDDGAFKVIDWSDRDRPDKMEAAEIIHHPRCQFVLKCQYNPRWRVPKLRPFFYFEKTGPREFSAGLDRLRAAEKTGAALYWRGNQHEGRAAVLAALRDRLNPDYAATVDRPRYYEELARHAVALSLPGLGKSCHREFECFAVGTVVVAPAFQNAYHAPVVPDHHYLAVGPGPLPDAIRERLARTTPADLAAVRRNAMAYYDAHLRFEPSVALLPHLLEL